MKEQKAGIALVSVKQRICGATDYVRSSTEAELATKLLQLVAAKGTKTIFLDNKAAIAIVQNFKNDDSNLRQR